MVLSFLRARHPGAPLTRIVGWYLIHSLCYGWVSSCYRYRAWGGHHIPRTGPVLLVSNHQSYLDPILVGVSCHRRQFHAMARSTLFVNPLFAGLIRFVHAFPVERGSTDVGAIRRSIGVLQRGHAMLIFPEGTRTDDGTVRPFHSGTMLLIKRARPLVIPVAIEGAYRVWPKGQPRPHATGCISVMYGKPVPSTELIRMGTRTGLEALRTTIDDMRQRLAHRHAHRELV